MFWPVFQKKGASSCAVKDLYGSGFSYCGTVPEGQEHLPSWSMIEDMYSSGHFDVVIYTNEKSEGCDGILRMPLGVWDSVPWVNAYLKRWPNTSLAYVDGNDINGCHQAPHFDRIDLVFRREMQLCERECRSFGTSLTFPGRTRYLCV